MADGYAHLVVMTDVTQMADTPSHCLQFAGAWCGRPNGRSGQDHVQTDAVGREYMTSLMGEIEVVAREQSELIAQVSSAIAQIEVSGTMGRW